MKNGPIVILGGYGQVGRSLTALLLEHSQAKLIVAGRRLEAAQAFIAQLDDPQIRLVARYADAAKPETLREAFQGASLVIVVATAPQYAANIANACLQAGCDYFDVLEMAVGTQALMAMNSAVQNAGRLFVTQGVLAPGLPAAFARLACSKLDRCQCIRLGLALSFKTMERVDQVIEVFKYVTQHPPRLYQDGRWQQRPLGKDRTTIDYGALWHPSLDVNRSGGNA
jgi:saccharopine dehydrogenase-like NADP-dependent oxidoreductase